MRILILGLLLPVFGWSQCYESRLALNFNIGTPFKSGMELTFFPHDGKIGFDAGGYFYQKNTVYGKNKILEQPAADPIGRIIFRLNEPGDFQHQVTLFGTPKQIGISYRLYYRAGDVLLGIEPTVSTSECGVNALVTFDL